LKDEYAALSAAYISRPAGDVHQRRLRSMAAALSLDDTNFEISPRICE
jgi:hypothetical protein